MLLVSCLLGIRSAESHSREVRQNDAGESLLETQHDIKSITLKFKHLDSHGIHRWCQGSIKCAQWSLFWERWGSRGGRLQCKWLVRELFQTQSKTNHKCAHREYMLVDVVDRGVFSKQLFSQRAGPPYCWSENNINQEWNSGSQLCGREYGEK